MDKFECENKIRSIHARAMQEINSYIKEYAFSKFGIKEGDIIYYQHYNANRPTYLYIEKISSNVQYVLSRGADLKISFNGIDVDANGYKGDWLSHSIVNFDGGVTESKLISITDIKYKG